MGNEGLFVKKGRESTRVWRRPENKALNPQSQKATALKIEEESGCVLLKFLAKERKNGKSGGMAYP